jgi:hypothetical protein
MSVSGKLAPRLTKRTDWNYYSESKSRNGNKKPPGGRLTSILIPIHRIKFNPRRGIEHQSSPTSGARYTESRFFSSPQGSCYSKKARFINGTTLKYFMAIHRFSAGRAFYTVGVVAMTEQQRAKLMEALEKQAAHNATSAEAARQFLIETGTYTPQGNLTPEFGGPALEQKD